MTWKRVRRIGGREGTVEIGPGGAVLGPARSWFLVPEDEASDCCWKVNEKDTDEPETDPYDGLLVVPADHVEQTHPENAG